MGKKILFCNCCSERISPERLQSIENGLINVNIDLIKVNDLCGVSVLDKEKLRAVFGDNDYLIVGCHSRALKLVLEKAGINSGDHACRFINFFESGNEDIFKEAGLFSTGNDINGEATKKELSNSSDWASWFPVIDYSRCTSCGQCADFCLFGVYEKADGKVSVINPQQCKNNCPACARICPRTAIIFPKYKDSGAIGGSDITDEFLEQKRQVEDINSIMNGDIYTALEQRKKKRKSIIHEEAMQKAIEERLKALNNQKPENG